MALSVCFFALTRVFAFACGFSFTCDVAFVFGVAFVAIIWLPPYSF
jgi:hypothetical protein